MLKVYGQRGNDIGSSSCLCNRFLTVHDWPKKEQDNTHTQTIAEGCELVVSGHN